MITKQEKFDRGYRVWLSEDGFNTTIFEVKEKMTEAQADALLASIPKPKVETVDEKIAAIDSQIVQLQTQKSQLTAARPITKEL